MDPLVIIVLVLVLLLLLGGGTGGRRYRRRGLAIPVGAVGLILIVLIGLVLAGEL